MVMVNPHPFPPSLSPFSLLLFFIYLFHPLVFIFIIAAPKVVCAASVQACRAHTSCNKSSVCLETIGTSGGCNTTSCVLGCAVLSNAEGKAILANASDCMFQALEVCF